MRYILDTAKPRPTHPKWLAVSAPLALALLSLAALRVSARPPEAKPQRVEVSTRVNSRMPPFLQSKPADPADKPGTTDSVDAAQDRDSPALTLKSVIWGKAVDGLEPGILLTTPGSPINRRVPFNSRVDYKVLVRNTTGRERVFELQCRNWDEQVPYLIPGRSIRGALGSRTIPDRFRAIGVADLSLVQPAYDVKLAPDEAVVVPGELRLYIGGADMPNFPLIESIDARANWIVQPVTIRTLTAAEIIEANTIMSTPYSSKTVVTIVGSDGKPRQRSVPVVGAGSGGKQIFALMQLDVIPSRATPPSTPTVKDGVAWGKEWNGLQLGMRLPRGVTTFRALSQAQFEVLLRNRSNKPVQFSWLGYPNIEQYSPEIFASDGTQIDYIRTIAGPYAGQETDLAGNGAVVLGTIALPDNERATLDSLPTGPYLISGPPPPTLYQAAFSLQVTLPGRKAHLLTSRIGFTVSR